MAILMEMDFAGVTEEQYDRVDERVGTRAAQPPDGLLFHAGTVTREGLHVVDVWESQAQLDRFMERLVPVAREAGFPDPTTPAITEVHHLYEHP